MASRGKMSVEMRAKQFMPFSALPGLDEALARAEADAECEAKAPVHSTEAFDISLFGLQPSGDISSDSHEELYEEYH